MNDRDRLQTPQANQFVRPEQVTPVDFVPRSPLAHPDADSTTRSTIRSIIGPVAWTAIDDLPAPGTTEIALVSLIPSGGQR